MGYGVKRSSSSTNVRTPKPVPPRVTYLVVGLGHRRAGEVDVRPTARRHELLQEQPAVSAPPPPPEPSTDVPPMFLRSATGESRSLR